VDAALPSRLSRRARWMVSFFGIIDRFRAATESRIAKFAVRPSPFAD
jgi:hypothetical protein